MGFQTTLNILLYALFYYKYCLEKISSIFSYKYRTILFFSKIKNCYFLPFSLLFPSTFLLFLKIAILFHFDCYSLPLFCNAWWLRFWCQWNILDSLFFQPKKILSYPAYKVLQSITILSLNLWNYQILISAFENRKKKLM